MVEFYYWFANKGIKTYKKGKCPNGLVSGGHRVASVPFYSRLHNGNTPLSTVWQRVCVDCGKSFGEAGIRIMNTWEMHEFIDSQQEKWDQDVLEQEAEDEAFEHLSDIGR